MDLAVSVVLAQRCFADFLDEATHRIVAWSGLLQAAPSLRDKLLLGLMYASGLIRSNDFASPPTYGFTSI